MRFVFAVVGALLLLAAMALCMFALFDQPVDIQEEKPEPQIEFVDKLLFEDSVCEADQSVKTLLTTPQVCQRDSDCMIKSYGYPFGCKSLVNQQINQQINEILTKDNVHLTVFTCV